MEREDQNTVRIGAPTLGRSWRLSVSRIERLLERVSAQAIDDPAVQQLIQLGLLTKSEGSDEARWGPVRRYHAWSGVDHFRDGADTTGSGREAALSLFSDADLAALREPQTLPGEPEPLPEPWAAIAWAALTRVRDNLRRLREASHPAELLHSYGAAHGLLVLSETDGHIRATVADPASFGTGRRRASIAIDEVPGIGVLAPASIVVFGDLTAYRRRYRHEKSFRGFLVDGGRLSAEVARALRAKGLRATTRTSFSDPAILSALGLEPFVHHLAAAYVVDEVQP